MKIGIVGSRTRNSYDDHTQLRIQFQFWLNRYSRKNTSYQYGDIHIISGGQIHGADGWAEAISHDYSYPITIYRADWNTLGKAAGPIRNSFIAKESDVLIACPSEDSKGTRDTIEKFKKFHPTGELILV